MLLEATRPRQWVKNLLVLAAPLAAGVLGVGAVVVRSAGLVLALTLVAAAAYLVNDVADAGADRLHPVKRCRPVASGRLPRRRALLCAALLAPAGAVLGLIAGGPRAVLLLAGYAALTAAYSLRLKRLPYLELAVVAAGFVLRALAGGLAGRVPLSPWFLGVVSFAALLVVTGKRRSELFVVVSAGGHHRTVLRRYPPRVLAALSHTLAAGLLLLWVGWLVTGPGEHTPAGPFHPWVVSVLPLAAAIARYQRLVGRGLGGAPEDMLLRDRTLAGCAAAVVASVAVVALAG